MIDKLLIITTAITRPDIHNISFPSITHLFNNLDIQIKWFINVDTYENNNISPEETIKNLKKILSSFDVTYNITDKSDFFNAVNISMQFVSENITPTTAVFWLEDDWIFNDKYELDLNNIFNLYLCDYCYISLVFNKLGSFPPFIADYKLFKTYILPTFTNPKREEDPEDLCRRGIRRRYMKMNKICRYFLLDYPIIDETFDKQELLDALLEKETYYNKSNEHYLVISQNIQTDILNKFYRLQQIEKQSIKICSYNDFTKMIKNNSESSKYINIIRFGKYDLKNKYFIDIGRDWKKNMIIK